MHPKTGRICVPIPRENLWEFNPETVPTVRELYDELNENFHDHQVTKQNTSSFHYTMGIPQRDKEETALSPYLHCFQQFVADLQNAVQEEHGAPMNKMSV